MVLVAELPHWYASPVFKRSDRRVNNVPICDVCNVGLITVELPGVVVHSAYKPPGEQFVVPLLGWGTYIISYP